MKKNKHDGVVELVSDNFIHGSNNMFEYLRDLYSCYLQHGFMPEAMLLSTIIPISKDLSGTGQKSDGYRGIALKCLMYKGL
jgi:hypothetical protein